jgi:release factor glutamine methyltransferase
MADRLSIGEALSLGKDRLSKIAERPIFETEILLQKILNKDRLFIILNSNFEFDKTDFLELLRRRENGEPIEYITNRVSFYSEDFYISKGALIPRPETEILVEKTLEIAKEFKNPRILEIGVGSGIISIMLSKLLPDAKIIGVDISENALKIAEKNRIEKNILNVEFRQSDLFQNVSEKFDLIVSNPPYISDSERGKLQKELEFEPENALYGGEIGDEVLQKIVLEFLKRDEKYLLCEMGFDQKEKIQKLENENLKIDFYQDLANLDRGFVAKKHNLIALNFFRTN